jgi:hypothetical protein
LLKYAGELRVGDLWMERPQGRPALIYRVIAISPGLASTTIRVAAACVTTGRRRTMDFFLVNRVEVQEERSLNHAEASATAVDQSHSPADAAAQHPTARLTGLRAMRTHSGASYHAIPAGGHRWIRAICGAAPGSRSAGWTVTGGEITCPRCQQRMHERTTRRHVPASAHR